MNTLPCQNGINIKSFQQRILVLCQQDLNPWTNKKQWDLEADKTKPLARYAVGGNGIYIVFQHG